MINNKGYIMRKEKKDLINMEDVTRLKLAHQRRISLQSWTYANYDSYIYEYDGSLNNVLEKSCLQVIDKVNKKTVVYESNSERVNEFGNKTEDWLVEELINNGLNAKKLGGSAYPDLNIEHDSLNYYIECKTASKLISNSSMRTFYTTTASSRTKKIKDIKTGFHLLCLFETKGRGKNVEYTGNFIVYDLADFIYTDCGWIQQGSAKDYLNLKKAIICQNIN